MPSFLIYSWWLFHFAFYTSLPAQQSLPNISYILDIHIIQVASYRIYIPASLSKFNPKPVVSIHDSTPLSPGYPSATVHTQSAHLHVQKPLSSPALYETTSHPVPLPLCIILRLRLALIGTSYFQDINISHLNLLPIQLFPFL